MNELNNATLEACQRLLDAGIVLETEAIWFFGTDNIWHLSDKSFAYMAPLQYPAPMFTEVWRELKNHMSDYDTTKNLVWDALMSEKPIDRMIDLLIWVTKQKGQEKI